MCIGRWAWHQQSRLLVVQVCEVLVETTLRYTVQETYDVKCHVRFHVQVGTGAHKRVSLESAMTLDVLLSDVGRARRHGL